MSRIRRYGQRTLVFALALASSMAAIPSVTSAQVESEPVEGFVVQVTEGELIVDIGTSAGLPATGVSVEVFRRVEVEHPVTKKTLVDRFPIGTLELVEIGSTLSLASKPAKKSMASVAVGDYVVYRFPRVEVPPEPVAAPDPKPAIDRERAALDAAFQATLGRTFSDRIRVWDAYLTAFPEGRFASAVGREVSVLRARLGEMRKAEQATPPAADVVPVAAYVAAPRRARVGDPWEVAVAITRPEEVQHVRLLVRRPSQPYQTHELAREGDFFWRGALAASQLAAGGLEYFVEAVQTDGNLRPLAGNAGKPVRVEIVDSTSIIPVKSGRSRARLLFDAVDFKAGAGDDHYTRFEADYRYLVDYGWLHAFSVGVGIFDGRGGTLRQVRAGESRDLATSYGYTEAEFALHEYVGIAGRLLVGNQSTDDGGELRRSLGVRSELRLGPEDGTKLRLGGAFTDTIGNEGWIELEILALENVPMTGSAIVTNLPVGKDLGVSLNYGIGYRFFSWLTPMVRVGWNARTINHTGASVGIGTLIEW